MKIILSPIASDHTTTVSLAGLTLTIDGQDYDLSQIPDGGQADGDDNFIGPVTRDAVTVAYHYDSAKAEPMQSTDIADYTFEVTSGEVQSPIVWKQEESDVIH